MRNGDEQASELIRIRILQLFSLFFFYPAFSPTVFNPMKLDEFGILLVLFFNGELELPRQLQF